MISSSSQCSFFLEVKRSKLYACFKKNICVCEIGVQTGANAINMYNIIAPKKLYLIDPWKINSFEYIKRKNKYTDETIVQYKLLLKSLHKDFDVKNPDFTYQYFYEEVIKLLGSKENVEVIRKFSEDAVNDISDNSIDLLYIDGNHAYDYVFKDLTLYEKKISHDGVIMGNDFVKSRKNSLLSHYEVIQAVINFIKIKPEWRIFLINNDQYADFILSRNPEFESRFINTAEGFKFGIKKLKTNKLVEFLSSAVEVDFSKISRNLFLLWRLS